MASFIYTAINSDGKESKGSMEAVDAVLATANLREQGLFVTNIRERNATDGGVRGSFSEWLAKNRSIPSSHLVFFFKQLAFMLRAGLPVLQALEIFEQQSSGRLHFVVKQLLTDIKNGSSFSKAMKRHKDVFPSVAPNLILAGENTGELDEVANRLATHLEKKAALRAQTINALIYPAFVVLVATGVVGFLMLKVVPQFAKFLAGRGKQLPPSTQFLIDVSNFTVEYSLVIFGVFIAISLTIFLFYQTTQGRLVLDTFLLKIPVIGKLLSHGIIAELTWSLSMMLRSGLTAFDSLKITSSVISNQLISNKLNAASERILAGKDLSSSIQTKAIPTLVTQMTAVGEKTGTLDQVLQELGIFYEELLEVGVKRMSAMIEPAMILVIGSIVGFVYYAFFQALFSLSSR